MDNKTSWTIYPNFDLFRWVWQVIGSFKRAWKFFSFEKISFSHKYKKFGKLIFPVIIRIIFVWKIWVFFGQLQGIPSGNYKKFFLWTWKKKLVFQVNIYFSGWNFFMGLGQVSGLGDWFYQMCCPKFFFVWKTIITFWIEISFLEVGLVGVLDVLISHY